MFRLDIREAKSDNRLELDYVSLTFIESKQIYYNLVEMIENLTLVMVVSCMNILQKTYLKSDKYGVIKQTFFSVRND